MIRRLAVRSVLAAAVLATWAQPAGAASAIQPSNRPTPVAGQENGRMTADQLVYAAPGCRTYRAAAPSAHLLFTAAQAGGINLIGRDCYRTVDGQVAEKQDAVNKNEPTCAATPQTTSTGQVKGTSMHGWGKAIDFGDPTSLNFKSRGYSWLKGHAARYGWNHPGWAEPGGSSCPEAWHWEWVGDGGTLKASPIVADRVTLLPTATGGGYTAVTGLGATTNKGDAVDHGSLASTSINWVVVGGARAATGYWMVAGDGGTFAFGDAKFFGSTGAMTLNKPIVGMAATPTKKGYWLVASDGGIFTFGDAKFFGSTGSMTLNSPIVGMAATPSGKGYWLVAGDGGIFNFGDATFHGSTGGIKLNEPIAAMAAAPEGTGYWLAASDGGVFTFGSASFEGSAPRTTSDPPVVSIGTTPAGDGYWLAAADGTVRAFGKAPSL